MIRRPGESVFAKLLCREQLETMMDQRSRVVWVIYGGLKTTVVVHTLHNNLWWAEVESES